MSSDTLLVVLDIVGIIVFAISGALTGVEKRLDIFGVIFLADATALGGGFIRDALLGAFPVAALHDWRYLVAPTLTGLIVFYIHPAIAKLSRILLIVDAAGLALFAVAGAHKALDHGIGAVGACAIGTITAIGGGIIRDVVVREIPTVLHKEIYATAALLGGVLFVTGDGFGWNNVATAAVAIALAFTLRVVSTWRQWSAPVAKQ
jgi:uncharacterized membrane protein YeiH